MPTLQYSSRSGIVVTRKTSRVPFKKGLQALLHELDGHRGIYLSSGYEYPGRYSRWDVASLCPPIEIVAFQRDVTIRALNERGSVLVRLLQPALAAHPHWESFALEGDSLQGRLRPLPAFFSEEERSKQPSVFSVLRALISEFATSKDNRLSLVGAFGYDLLFQFDPITLRLPRSGRKDLHLFLCDDIYYMDRKREVIERFEYEFGSADGSLTTDGLARTAETVPPPTAVEPGPIVSDHTPEEYMANVETCRREEKLRAYRPLELNRADPDTRRSTPPGPVITDVYSSSEEQIPPIRQSRRDVYPSVWPSSDSVGDTYR